jgi:aminoglycoside phosphotransferase (APT) family kinase protein
MAASGELYAALVAALGQATGSRVEIKTLALMPGGASQEMWRLDLSVPEGAWKGEYPLVMRRQVGTKIWADALEPESEFRVLQAAYESGAPAPHPYWLFHDLLGRAALVMGRLEGETIGRRVVKEPALAEARRRLPGQMGAALAAIHRVDADKFGLSGILPAPARGQTPARFLIGRTEADLDRVGEPHPALELGLRWLRRHEPPPPERLVLVHGDFRIGNILVNPDGLGGVLDWEFAHIGDPAEDLFWGLVRDWRFGADHLHYGGVGEPEEFFAAYEERGGGTVDRAHVSYWEVMGNVRWAVGTLNQAQRHLRGQEPNLELASLGRRCAEMELEALRLMKGQTA